MAKTRPKVVSLYVNCRQFENDAFPFVSFGHTYHAFFHIIGGVCKQAKSRCQLRQYCYEQLTTDVLIYLYSEI